MNLQYYDDLVQLSQYYDYDTFYLNIVHLHWFERCWNHPVYISVPLVLPWHDHHSL